MGVMAGLFLSCRLAKTALGLQLLLPSGTKWAAHTANETNQGLMLAALCAAVASRNRCSWTAAATRTSIPALLARYPHCWPSEQCTMSTAAAPAGAPPQQCVGHERLR